MIEFRCLGSSDLRGADGAALHGMLSGSKRLALLSYLALARPRDFHRRDMLLTLFWPESDQKRARTSLRNMLHQIRGEIGSEIVVNRGSEEIGLADGVLWCDAVEFQQRAEAGRFEDALDLYRGDLLEGLHVADAAPELDRWLEGERARLRRTATQAAEAWVEQAEASGDLELAVRCARRGSELSPWDEALARKLIKLLAGAGKRAEALHAYEAFAERLRTDLELEPSAETERLVREVRERGSAPEPPATRVAPTDLRPSELPDTEPVMVGPVVRVEHSEGRTVSPWRVSRRARVFVGGLALLILAVGTLLSAVNPRGTPPLAGSSSLTRVAILPFAYHGSHEHSYLGEGMVDLLSAALHGVDGLQSVDQHALVSVLRQEKVASSLAPAQAQRLAARLGIDRYVVGSITATAGQFQLQAALHDAQGQRLAMVTAVAPDEGELLTAVEALARQLLAEEFQRSGDRMTHLAAGTTSSLPALKSYLQGMQLLRRGDGAGAGEVFERAIQADSSFALAFYGLAVAGGWGHVGSSADAIERGLRWAERLPERERMLLEAYHAHHVGKHRDAEQLYGTILATAPDHVAAWFGLADMLFHQAVLTGRTPSAAREAFERVLSFVPDHAFSLVHVSSLLAAERQIEELAPVTERMLRSDAAVFFKLGARTESAFLRGDSLAQRQALAGLDSVGNVMNITMTSLFLSHTGELEGARRVTDLVAGNATYPAQARLQMWLMGAEHELGRGRWDAARRRLEEASRIDAPRALAAHAYLATAPSIPAPEDELRALRRRLRELREPDAALADAGLPGRYIHHYLLGLLSARLGDEADAIAHADRLAALPGVPASGSLVRDLVATIRAYSHSVQQRPGPALAEMEAMEMHVPIRNFMRSQAASLSHSRFLRAQLLHVLDREEEALRWYAAATHASVGVPLNMASAHLGIARIYDARGERGNAAEHYRRAAMLWKVADPPLRPGMDHALRRLAELERMAHR